MKQLCLNMSQRPTVELSCPRPRVAAYLLPAEAMLAGMNTVDTVKADKTVNRRSIDVMDVIGAEHHVDRANWLHTPKFGPTYHFQRWRRAT